MQTSLQNLKSLWHLLISHVAVQDGRAKPEADDVGRGLVLHRGRADANEPRRARDTLDDRRRPREEERRRPKEEIVFRAPEAVPEPQV